MLFSFFISLYQRNHIIMLEEVISVDNRQPKGLFIVYVLFFFLNIQKVSGDKKKNVFYGNCNIPNKNY